MNNLSPINSKIQVTERLSPTISGIFQRWLNIMYTSLNSIHYGEYVPILTADSNVSQLAVIFDKFNFMKIGNNVSVFGNVAFLTPVASLASFYISLPVGSEFTMCSGIGASYANIHPMAITFDGLDYTKPACVLSNSTNTSSALPYQINFSYNIK